MTQQQSKLRQQAEIAFRKLQAPALAKNRPEEIGTPPLRHIMKKRQGSGLLASQKNSRIGNLQHPH